ncbi:MAG TPA: serine/threonine-protein kinase [Vicinamibacterales bacterium]
MADVPDDPEVLSSVAASISDGALIEWDKLARQVTGEDDSVLNELQVLERIAKFHQSAQEGGAANIASAADDDATNPRGWAHFLILGRIGRGSFGNVYRAHDTKLQCDIALKLMRDQGDSPANVSRVLKEARLLARVRHPNVVTVYGADQIDGRVGLWMELVRGTTLEDLLQRQGTFGAREASVVGLDMCRAVAAVHRAGLLHGDIKAHNVMREEGGRNVLMDFGAGKDLDLDFLRAYMGGADDFAGTPLYLAPEVFAGSPRTKATDVYSLGVLLFRLATKRYPVEGETRADVEDAHRQHTRTHLRDLRPDLPDEFVTIVERALDPDPRKRYQTAGAFELALARFLGAPVENRNDDSVKRRAPWIALAAVLAAMVIGAPVYWLATRTPATPARPVAATTPLPVAARGASAYTIDAGLYRLSDTGEARLRPGDRVTPGDQLALQIQVSKPTHIYVVNEDDRGESYLLFPLPDHAVANPIPAGRIVRLPASEAATQLYWKVTSAGGREHFLIFATPEPLPAFDRMFASLPRPQLNAPVLASPLSPDAVGVLRGVGGLSASPRSSSGRLAEKFTTTLPQTAESADGLWVRQITLENPR